MTQQIMVAPEQVAGWYAANAAGRTRTALWIVGSIILAVLVYWVVVNYIGKNYSSGKSFKDTPPPLPQNANTSGSNVGNVGSEAYPEDPFKYANELHLRLVPFDLWYWYEPVCAGPDDLCYRLQKMQKSGDGFIAAVGRAYLSSNGKKLSDAIKKNPCGCVESCLTCRTTKYQIDKNGLIGKLASFGY